MRLKKKYASVTSGYLSKRHAKKNVRSFVTAKRESACYLSHRPRVHPRLRGKLRVVLDSVCQFRSISLNSQLLSGPDMAPGFRQYPYFIIFGVTSGCLRFLQRSNPETGVSSELPLSRRETFFMLCLFRIRASSEWWSLANSVVLHYHR